MKLIKEFMIFFIRLVSKIFRSNNLRACRFYPSCSEYSVEAFQKFNSVQAFYWMARRVLRCHPFSEGGYDPLPQAKLTNHSKWCFRRPWKEKLLFFWRCHFYFWDFIQWCCSISIPIIINLHGPWPKNPRPLHRLPKIHPRLLKIYLPMKIWRFKARI